MVWVEALLPKVVDGKVCICLSTEESMHQARRWGIEFLGRISVGNRVIGRSRYFNFISSRNLMLHAGTVHPVPFHVSLSTAKPYTICHIKPHQNYLLQTNRGFLYRSHVCRDFSTRISFRLWKRSYRPVFRRVKPKDHVHLPQTLLPMRGRIPRGRMSQRLGSKSILRMS